MPTTTLAAAARLLADSFTTKTRDNGTTFTLHTDTAPTWCKNATREAHGDALPNDWIYGECARIASELADMLAEGGNDDFDGANDIMDSLTTWNDTLSPDIYNWDRAKWLADHMEYAMEACDEARENAPDTDWTLMDSIGAGQESARRQIAYTLAQAIVANAE